ncbi:hypothetical protein AB0I61_17390 [Polymorphospora rubra]|uniref:hypothetical protein n=1 Tax=Polymorphospora rubra TaxID=338584 RepID=UPI0033C9EE55
MAEFSWPSPNHNGRAVTDDEYERLVGAYTTDGLIGPPPTQPVVYADSTGLLVRVRPDRSALVRGRMWSSGPTSWTRAIGSNGSGALRWDLIVLRFSRTTWDVTLEVVQGTPGAGVPAATVDPAGGGIWELPIASVRVTAGATTIAAGDVTMLAWYLGQDGQIVCRQAAEVPHNAGRLVFETETSRTLVSTGTTWTVLRDDTGWINLTPATGWRSRLLKGRRVNGNVNLICNVARNNVGLAGATASIITTLPTSLRPTLGKDEHVVLTGTTPSGAGYAFRMIVNETGQVRLETPHGGLGPTSWLETTGHWAYG